jgi:hypothetical protein
VRATASKSFSKFDGEALYREAVIAFAGPAAERRLLECGVDDFSQLWNTAWSADRANALQHLRSMGADPLTVLQVMQQAEWLVNEHWSTILRVAEALIERGELDGYRVAMLIDQEATRAEIRTSLRLPQLLA